LLCVPKVIKDIGKMPKEPEELGPPPKVGGPGVHGGTGTATNTVVGGFPPAAPPPPATKQEPEKVKVVSVKPDGPIRVGGNVQAANLVRKVVPVYPPLAKQARVQGVVRFTAIIGRDGLIQQLQVVSGHPLLIPAATEAVKQWVYRPTLLNQEPVEVITQIDVSFTLSS
jgi:protein TonB